MTEDREKRFMVTIRRALMLVVRWIEQEYGIEPANSIKR